MGVVQQAVCDYRIIDLPLSPINYCLSYLMYLSVKSWMNNSFLVPRPPAAELLRHGLGRADRHLLHGLQLQHLRPRAMWDTPGRGNQNWWLNQPRMGVLDGSTILVLKIGRKWGEHLWVPWEIRKKPAKKWRFDDYKTFEIHWNTLCSWCNYVHICSCMSLSSRINLRRHGFIRTEGVVSARQCLVSYSKGIGIAAAAIHIAGERSQQRKAWLQGGAPLLNSKNTGKKWCFYCL